MEQRKRFDEEVRDRLQYVTTSLLTDVPELNMLVVVPVWDPPQPNLHPMLVATRGNAPATPDQLIRMTDRLLQSITVNVRLLQQMHTALTDAINQKAKELHDSAAATNRPADAADRAASRESDAQ